MKDNIDLIAQDLTMRARAMFDGSSIAAKDENHPTIDAIVRQMLVSGSELMVSCASLAHGSHDLAINILNRSIIEMGIKVHWATISSDNALLLQEATKEQLKTIFKVNTKKGLLKVIDKSGIDHTASFLASGGANKGPKTPSIEIMATQCGLSDIYNIFYRFQSLHTHSNHVHSNSAQTAAQTLGYLGIFSTLLGNVGVRWLIDRSRPSNDEIRALLGFDPQRQQE